jgi:hypothetical protein
MEDEAKKPDNRKNRRKKKNWEKLKESPIVGISTLPGGGLVSAPIMGKALGSRIGRRIGGAGKTPTDMNPATARDADKDMIVLEGVPTINQGRGVPDPTPGGEISGRMGREQNKEEFVGLEKLLRQHFGQFAKFQEWTRNKDWRAFHRNHFDWWMFPIPRGSNTYRDEYNVAGEPLAELLNNRRYMETLPAAMRMYLRSIGWDMDKKNWIADADIENGQEPVRSLNQARLYKIAQSAEAHNLIDELRSVSLMVDDMRASGIRVGNDNYWNSISGRMANNEFVKPDFPENAKPGDKYSTGVEGDTREWQFDGRLWVRQDSGGKRAATMGFRKAGGSTGKSISPSATSIAVGQNKRAMTYGTPEFDEIWARRDANNEAGEGDGVTFDWKDESSRLQYIALMNGSGFPMKHPKTRKRVGWAKFGEGANPPGDYPRRGVPGWVDRLKPELKDLGIAIVPKDHSTMGDQYGSWISFSGTPGSPSAEGQAAKQLLTHLAETISPDTFYEHFEAWLRNPYVTAKKNGKDVGVRLAFNNDRERLLNEYRRRVIALRDSMYDYFGNPMDEVGATMVKPVVDDELSPSTQIGSTGNDWKDITSSAPWAAQRIAAAATEAAADEIPRSKDRLKHMIQSRVQMTLPQEIVDLIGTSESLIDTLLRENFKNRDWGRDSEFDAPDILPSGDAETLEIVDELGDQFIELITSRESTTEITDNDAIEFARDMADDSVNMRAVKPFLQKKLDAKISGRMGNKPETNVEAENIDFLPESPNHLGNHFTSRHEGYDIRPDPVDSIQEARRTGAPLKGLTPGSYSEQIQKYMNGLTDYVIGLGFTSYMQTNPDFYIGSQDEEGRQRAADFRGYLGGWIGTVSAAIMDLGTFGEDFELDDEHREFLRPFLGSSVDKMKNFSDIPDEDPSGYGGNTMQVLKGLLSRGVVTSTPTDGNELNDIATGLAMRAIHAAIKTNNHERIGVSDARQATEDTLDWWNDAIGAALLTTSPSDYESIDDIGYSNLMTESEVSVAMPVSAAIQMLREGEFKTLFETDTSQGNSNKSARRTAEFAMFGILPSYAGKRPSYGVLHVGGITEDALQNTNQYGPVRIVLKKDVNKDVTWTEIDSLSLMSSASTLQKPSKHSLFGQRLTADTPFTRVSAEDIIALIERGRNTGSADDKTAIGRTKYAEAQIHKSITPDDIAYIIIDDTEWYGTPTPDFPPLRANGAAINDDSAEYEAAMDVYPDDIMDYDGYIQISKIAESLNIPVIRASDTYDAGEEIIRP